jgi:DNA-binding IclR family transcriptional regulator
MKTPAGETYALDLAHDLAEDGGVECEMVLLDWVTVAGDAGLTAAEAAERADIPLEHAEGRLTNLWENDFLRVDPPGIPHGRFFLIPDEDD